MDRTKFHEFEIGGLKFTASIGAVGPTLTASKGIIPYGSIPLGPTVKLDVIPEYMRRGKPAMFGLFNPKGQAKIRLEELTSEESMALAREFGISIAGVQDSPTFTQSKAWLSLKSWVAHHPKLAIAYSSNATYLPNWYQQALN